jgi:hypothetical protein
MAEDKKRKSLYDKMGKEAKKTEHKLVNAEDKDAKDKLPDEDKGGDKGDKGGEKKHEKHHGHADVHARHHEERAALHKRHEGERKDLHGNHREEHRQMFQRHEKDWKDLNAKQDSELEGGVGGGIEAPAAQEPAGSPMTPGSGA